ncbi:hypothetical protein CCP3SC1AL1_2740004 [Gammaproteobacteria bacterium]
MVAGTSQIALKSNLDALGGIEKISLVPIIDAAPPRQTSLDPKIFSRFSRPAVLTFGNL